MVEKATYQGNCHCAKFRFEVQLPDITSAITCNCTACFKTGFLWAFPADGDYRVIRDDGLLIGTQHGKTLDRKFCSNCSSSVVGTHLTGPLEGKFGINIRSLLDVNPFKLEVEQSNHPSTKINTPETTVDPSGYKTYKGSCVCKAVLFDFKTKALPELAGGDIKEDNCSICVRHAYIGVYPSKSQVEIPSSSEANASTYAWRLKFSGLRSCKHCGIYVFSDLWGPPAELVATWPEARQQMVKQKLAIKPLNVRALEGVEWDRIHIERSDEGTEGYVVE